MPSESVQYFYAAQGAAWPRTTASRQDDKDRLVRICGGVRGLAGLPDDILRRVAEYATCVDTPVFTDHDGSLVCVHRSHFGQELNM